MCVCNEFKDFLTPFETRSMVENCCSYCKKEQDALLQCKSCDKLFCNDTTKNISHFVYHSIKAKHAECELPSSHPLGPLDIDCYTCKTKNIFILGCIPAQSNETMILVCRDCTGSNKLTSEWNTSMWTSLIVDKKLQDWIMESSPSFLNVQDLQTIHLELFPSRSLIQEESEIELPPVLPKYENGSEYKEILTPLIQAEADYDKILKEMNTQDNISINWKSSYLAEFQLSKFDQLKLNLGDDLKITYHGELSKLWEGYFTVIELPHNTNASIVAEFKKMPLKDRNVACLHGDPIVRLTESYKIEFVWKSTSFDRMHTALKQFTTNRNAVSSPIYNIILGKCLYPKSSDLTIPRKLQVEGLPKLNPIQMDVASSVLKSNFSLVQGPPGTGKTVTSATVVYHLQKATNGKVLVCSPSNVAVDQLCEKLNQAKLNVVRLTAKSREHVKSNVAFLSVHAIAEQTTISPEYQALLLKKKAADEDLSQSDDKRIRHLQRQIERKILEEADVICCTCVGAGDPRLNKMKFETVVIDEATQATEPESLIPLVLGCKRAVLIGDHEQLPPVIMSKQVAKAGLTVSLFERLVKNGFKPSMLQIQYRMHPGLSEFPSNMFYEGNLQNGVNKLNRLACQSFPWPNPDLPMFFFNCQGQEEMSGTGLSYLNRAEASVVDKIVVSLIKAGVEAEQIGIITPYEGQRAFVTSHMMNSINREHLNKIEIASVDSFQGREKDYIILTCVRSNEKQGIGFLKDPRRLNVAITRAKYGLMIIGNPRVLSKNTLWYHLISHFKSKDLLVEGPLNNLKPSQITLVKPKQQNPIENNSHKEEENGTVPFDATLFEQSFANFSTMGTLNQEMLMNQYSPEEDKSGGGDMFDFAQQFKNLDITQSTRVEQQSTFEFLGDYKTRSFDDFFPQTK